MPSPSPDLVIRIALVRDETSLEELNPPIWRTFKVSSSVNLDLLHDKVLAPVMGWARNYHTYYFLPIPKKGSSDNGGQRKEADAAQEEKQEKSFEERSQFSDITGKVEGGLQEENCHYQMWQGDEFNGTDARGHRDKIHYVQTDTSASDALHVKNIVEADKIRKPEDCAIGDLLKEVGDRVIYVYDLGDCWYHMLEVEEVIDAEKSDAKVLIIDGAMRCPPEDADGCAKYQENVLDKLLEVRANPDDRALAREFADFCFLGMHRNFINVLGPFRPTDFDLSEREEAIADALASRNSSRNLMKTFTLGKPFPVARLGQRHIRVRLECDMTDRFGRPITTQTYDETINIKPDPRDGTLCYKCGSPHDLKMAISSYYCSTACQKVHWEEGGWKKQAKQEKRDHQNYLKEVETNTPDPNRFNNDGGSIPMKKYTPGKLRFKVGDFVECQIGADTYGTGRIVRLNYRQSNMAETAPYQIKLDRETADRVGVPFQQALIYSQWDDDSSIRLLEGSVAKKKSGKKGKKGRGRK